MRSDDVSKEVRFVYFDLDDTLLDHRHAERAALAELHAEFEPLASVDLDRFRDVYHDVNVQVWREYGAGRLTKHEARWIRFERMLTALDVDLPDPVFLGDRYLDLYADHWRFLPGAETAFARVAQQVRVGIVTNGFAEIQRAKFERFPTLGDRSAVILISEEVGFMKPDARLFRLAAETAVTPAENILYVGDSLHSDVEGALAAGWQVAWFAGDPDRAPRDAFVFDDWDLLHERYGF